MWPDIRIMQETRVCLARGRHSTGAPADVSPGRAVNRTPVVHESRHMLPLSPLLPQRPRCARVRASYPRWAPLSLWEWKAAGVGKAQPPPLPAPPGTGAGQQPVSITPKGAQTGPGTQQSLRIFHSCSFTNRNPVSATRLHFRGSHLLPLPSKFPFLLINRTGKNVF